MAARKRRRSRRGSKAARKCSVGTPITVSGRKVRCYNKRVKGRKGSHVATYCRKPCKK